MNSTDIAEEPSYHFLYQLFFAFAFWSGLAHISTLLRGCLLHTSTNALAVAGGGGRLWFAPWVRLTFAGWHCGWLLCIADPPDWML